MKTKGCLITIFVLLLGCSILYVIGGIKSSFDKKAIPNNVDITITPSGEVPSYLKPKTEDQLIEDQFYYWDGTHIKLTRAIKAKLIEPENFIHVKTTYVKSGENIIVKCEYGLKGNVKSFFVSGEYNIKTGAQVGEINTY